MREDEAQVLSAFDQANMRLPKRWAATNEKEAELIVIDMDTVYGHMTWLKANNDGKITVAVTTSDRAEADHVLPRPVTMEDLVNLLGLLSDQTPSANPIARTTGQIQNSIAALHTRRADKITFPDSMHTQAHQIIH